MVTYRHTTRVNITALSNNNRREIKGVIAIIDKQTLTAQEINGMLEDAVKMLFRHNYKWTIETLVQILGDMNQNTNFELYMEDPNAVIINRDIILDTGNVSGLNIQVRPEAKS